MGDKLTDTDMNPEPVEGVGESTTRRGEDVIKQEGAESGRHPNQGTKGADRPYGGAESESTTGVNPQPNIDESMPETTRGDQGG